MHDADALRLVIGLARARLDDLGDDARDVYFEALDRVREMYDEEQKDKDRNH